MNESNNECIEILKKKLETLKKEKEGVDGKLAGLLTASKDLDNLIESQSSDKNKDGLGYNVVPPPPTQLYLSPKKDLSWTGLPECADDIVTDYSRPLPTIENTFGNDQNKNPSVSETVASPITPKPFIKFVKPKDSQTKSKIDETMTPKKPPVKYAKKYKKPNKKPNVRGNQRNWNNLKSQQLGPNFFIKKKACFNCGDFNHLAYDCRKKVKKSFKPKHVTYRPPVRPVRTNMNGARPNRTSFNKQAHSYENTPFHRTSAGKSHYRAPWVPTVNRNFPLVNKKISTGSRTFPTANRNFPTASRKFPTGSTKCSTDGGCKITRKGTIKTGKLEFENVYFVKDLKYNLFSVLQIYDNKNNVLFTDSECIVLGRDFKLLDDANILLRTPRPGQLNFKTMNKLVRHNLVRGLPTKCFENDHTCTACLKGKQHKATCKSKLVNSMTKPLHSLHMDLFGPTSKGIKTEFSNARTPQQNGVAERRNRKGLSLEQENAKKPKISEEATEEAKTPDEVLEEKVKEMMQLVPIEEVYVEAFQVKHPIIDWKETLSNRPPTSDKEMELWVELSILYEPDDEDQLWTHTQNLMHALVEWKLYDSCRVHHVTSKDKEIFMLVEKDYPLRKGLVLVMIKYKLQVENYLQMANDLILKIYKFVNSPRQSPKTQFCSVFVVSQGFLFYHSLRLLRVFWIQQYLQHEHYAPWEVIEFGDLYVVPASPSSTTTTDTTSGESGKQSGRTVTLTAEDMQKKKNDVKARTTLLLSLPDEHQLAPRSQERGRRDNYRQGSKAEEQAPKALMVIDGVGWDWSYMENNEEDHALVADEVAPTEFALMANTSAESKKLETLKEENEGVDRKLAGLLTALKDLDNLIKSQRSDKNKDGLGYNDVPPPPAQLYLSPKKDLS
uniref:CCHC-type domain-containing protein n=1 Tax=Tanacetum cinerariifolium TaxID=118510 RepID=A0A6L2M3A1_TANCI|nr:hypothetical protein [Tanacetum cinerariifolium]